MAKSVSFHWESNPEDTFTAGVQQYSDDLVTMLQQIALEFEPQIENWMKTNAPWVDRTGNARQSLCAEVEQIVMGARIALDYGVSYGVFLELGMQSEYAIIAPALDYWSPLIWKEVQKRMGK